MGFTSDVPALQVIVLGAGGGPLEDNITAFLVRATASGWKKGSVMQVDGGVGLAAMARILDKHKQSRPFDKGQTSRDGARPPVTLIDGPFEGLEIPFIFPKANAKYIYRELIDTVLFTHPHMDHIMGSVVNTAIPASTRQKRFAGLPNTIEALKAHVFNNSIWPNLTDENAGAGIVSYIRLVEGGSPAAGQGDSKGYVELAPGLGVKTMSVSHGSCIENHAHRGSTPMMSPSAGEGSHIGSPISNTRVQRSNSNASANLDSGIPRIAGYEKRTGQCVYNSSVFFIRDSTTGREVVIFGDVEPDSISLSPRNILVWTEAAPKIASGQLTGIFIECSYDNSRDNDQLFGHMKPSFLMEELKILAGMVVKCGGGSVNKDTESILTSPKRKRTSVGGDSSTTSDNRQIKTPRQHSPPVADFPRGIFRTEPDLFKPGRRRNATSTATRDGPPPSGTEKQAADQKPIWPLKGLKVVLMHVKDNLDDGPDADEIIRQELHDLEEEAALGCEFIVSHSGQSLYF